MPVSRRIKIFLTHSWSDMKFARRLFGDLQKQGFEVWFDDKEIQGGERLAEQINLGLEWCDVYMPLLSCASLESPWCKEEINAALTLSNKPERQGRPQIVPVLVEHCQDKMPALLQARLYVDFTGRYQEAFQELLQKGLALDGADSGRSKPAIARRKRPTQTAVPPTPTLRPLVIGGALVALLLLAGGVFFALNQTGPGASTPPPTALAFIPTSTRSVQPTLLTPTRTALPASTALPAPSASPAWTATPHPPSGKIAFSKNEGDPPNMKFIWIMNADGSGAKKILDRASQPALSPDGNQIAYFRWSDGIFIANADGTGAKKIVGDSAILSIDWSPDGQWIAFATQPGGRGNSSINVVSVAGTGQRSLAIGESPSWSPDSTQIAFRGCADAGCGIYRVSLSGGAPAPLVTDDGSLPDWSPDGKTIVYQKEVGGQKHLFVVNSDGTGTKQLTSGAAMRVGATWSSDGNFIFYRSPEGGSWGIWLMNADGSHAVKLLDQVEPVNWQFERLAFAK